MQKAKQAVSQFLSHDGEHQTSVDESIRPAVTEEQIRPHKHENVTTAVQKDVHKEHHHTVVQPIKAKEVMPEKHVHKVAPVEHRTFDHAGSENLQASLEHDMSKYKTHSTTHNTTHSTTAAPIVTGERIHHHVHEHIQPVIEKETIVPEVLHTTVPIHETHYAPPVHHETTVLPTKSLEEFNKGVGSLRGEARTKIGEYEGCPKTFHENLEAQTSGSHNKAPLQSQSQKTTGLDNARGRSTTDTNKTAPGMVTNGVQKHDSGVSGSSVATKPSLKDKLNPFTDADGDGKKGILD